MDIIERVARATFEAVEANGGGFGQPWDHPDMKRVCDTHRMAARVMLETIREPSDAMKAAALRERGYDGDMTLRTYQAMIDAALREGK